MSKGRIDAQNSSTTPLGIAGVFTGEAASVSSFGTITVFMDTDQSGTLSMQFSSDGVNWDRQREILEDVNIASGSIHTLSVIASHFRIVYTNGAVAQTHFRLQTLFHQDKSNIVTTSALQTIGHTEDVVLTRNSNDPLLDLQRGLDKNKHTVHKFGFNEAVPNGSYADVWSYGGTDALYNWASTTETFRIKAGGNVNDTAAGTGARSVHIAYLDSTGVETHETLATAGASASAATASTGKRVLRAYVVDTGTILSNNTGIILIENSTTGEVVAEIDAGVGQTEMTMYTVPLGHTAYLVSTALNIAAGTNKDADVNFWQRTNAYNTTAPFGAKRLIKEWRAVQGHIDHNFTSYPVFEELTDLWFEGKGNGAVTFVAANFDIILIENEVVTDVQ